MTEIPRSPHPYLKLENGAQIEGYYLGTRQVPAKHGPTNLHVLKVDSELKGIWGFAKLDYQFGRVQTGTLVKLIGQEKAPLKDQKFEYNCEIWPDKELRINVNQDEVDIFASKASHRPAQALFLMPNGSALRYSMPHEPGEDKAFRLEDSLHLRNYDPPAKDKRYRLSLRSSGTRQHCVAADFDRVPLGFSDFDHLYNYLYESLAKPNKAVVFRSPSQKVKAVFVVELAKNIKMTDDLAIDALGMTLPGDLPLLLPPTNENTGKLILDYGHAGLCIVFLSKEIINTLALNLRHIIPYKLNTKGLRSTKEASGTKKGATGTEEDIDIVKDRNDKSNDLKSIHKLKVYNEVIPDFFNEFINLKRRNSKPRENFVRILLAASNLISHRGFAIPLVKMAIETKTTPTSVMTWRQDFIKRGWLKLLDGDSIPGKKAKIFAAVGKLQEAISTRTPKNNQTINNNDLPAKIEDGTWQKSLKNIAWKLRFRKKEEYLDYIKTLSGHELRGNGSKTRLKMAEEIFDWTQKKVTKYNRSK